MVSYGDEDSRQFDLWLLYLNGSLVDDFHSFCVTFIANRREPFIEKGKLVERGFLCDEVAAHMEGRKKTIYHHSELVQRKSTINSRRFNHVRLAALLPSPFLKRVALQSGLAKIPMETLRLVKVSFFFLTQQRRFSYDVNK